MAKEKRSISEKRELFRTSRERNVRFLYAICIYLFVVALTGSRLSGPSLVLNSPETRNQVSGVRAMEQIRWLIGPENATHNAGSIENEKVRLRLIQRLSELGLEPETQIGDFKDVPLTNVIVRRPGLPTPSPILFVTHYDSCKVGPGAGDAMSCVGAFLEVLRWLESSPIRSEIWFLFTDGEELGLGGAKLFGSSRLMNDLFTSPPLVFNFDARGVRGPSFMFQTNRNNYSLASRIVPNLAQPVFTNSLMVSVYEKLPNDTDFTVFKNAGHSGLNFALIYGAEKYHTPLDTPAHLSPMSVQHIASHVRSIIETLNRLPEDDWRSLTQSEPATYFDILSGPIVRYPQRFDVLIIVVLPCMFFGILIRSRMKYGVQRIRIVRVLLCFLFFVVSALVAGYSATWFFNTLGLFEGRYPEGSMAFCSFYLFLGGFLAFAFGNGYLVTSTRANVRIALYSTLALLSLTTFVYVPGGSHIFSWPALICGVICLLDENGLRWDYLFAGVMAILWVPLLLLFSGALGPQYGALLTALSAISLLPTQVFFAAVTKSRLSVEVTTKNKSITSIE